MMVMPSLHSLLDPTTTTLSSKTAGSNTKPATGSLCWILHFESWTLTISQVTIKMIFLYDVFISEVKYSTPGEGLGSLLSKRSSFVAAALKSETRIINKGSALQLWKWLKNRSLRNAYVTKTISARHIWKVEWQVPMPETLRGHPSRTSSLHGGGDSLKTGKISLFLNEFSC